MPKRGDLDIPPLPIERQGHARFAQGFRSQFRMAFGWFMRCRVPMDHDERRRTDHKYGAHHKFTELAEGADE